MVSVLIITNIICISYCHTYINIKASYTHIIGRYSYTLLKRIWLRVWYSIMSTYIIRIAISINLSHNDSPEAAEHRALPWRGKEVCDHVFSSQVVNFEILRIQELLNIEVLDVNVPGIFSTSILPMAKNYRLYRT